MVTLSSDIAWNMSTVGWPNEPLPMTSTMLFPLTNLPATAKYLPYTTRAPFLFRLWQVMQVYAVSLAEQPA